MSPIVWVILLVLIIVLIVGLPPLGYHSLGWSPTPW